MSDQMSEFDSAMERELHRVLDPVVASAVPSRRVRTSTHLYKKALGGAGMALGAKIVTGFAVAALAAGAATEVAITHSFNPSDWGMQVRSQVQGCSQGFNTCVTGFAVQPAAGAEQHRSTVMTKQGTTAIDGSKNVNPVAPVTGGTAAASSPAATTTHNPSVAPAPQAPNGHKSMPPVCPADGCGP
jgi:hypothetical protein